MEATKGPDGLWRPRYRRWHHHRSHPLQIDRCLATQQRRGSCGLARPWLSGRPVRCGGRRVSGPGDGVVAVASATRSPSRTRGAPSRREVRPYALARSVVANSARRYKVEVTCAMQALVDTAQRLAQVGEADSAHDPSWLCRSKRGDHTPSVLPMVSRRHNARPLASGDCACHGTVRDLQRRHQNHRGLCREHGPYAATDHPCCLDE
jgi:hypothetical protein